MADDRETAQLVKAKTSSLQKRDSNIVSRGLSDLALLGVEKAKIADDERLLKAREWFKIGTNYFFKNKEYDKAIEAFTSAITLSSNYYRAYVGRGAAYNEKGLHDMAIEDYTKAIALNPNKATAYNNRGLIYYKKGQYDKAIGDFQKGRDLGGWDWMRTLEKVLRQK
jgi:tetratricopeptide (TPR) repeat protein